MIYVLLGSTSSTPGIAVDGVHLPLDVTSHTLGITLLANGATAKVNADCYDGSSSHWTMWRVRFTEKERGYTIDRTGNCDDLVPFDIELFPGIYEVRAGGDSENTNLPGFDQVVIDKLAVPALPN